MGWKCVQRALSSSHPAVLLLSLLLGSFLSLVASRGVIHTQTGTSGNPVPPCKEGNSNLSSFSLFPRQYLPQHETDKLNIGFTAHRLPG